MQVHGTTAQHVEAARHSNTQWLEGCTIRLLCVLALDRFCDFTSDQVGTLDTPIFRPSDSVMTRYALGSRTMHDTRSGRLISQRSECEAQRCCIHNAVPHTLSHQLFTDARVTTACHLQVSKFVHEGGTHTQSSLRPNTDSQFLAQPLQTLPTS